MSYWEVFSTGCTYIVKAEGSDEAVDIVKKSSKAAQFGILIIKGVKKLELKDWQKINRGIVYRA